jgi:4-hydroxy 2-oxovalerate aldolase
MSQIKLLDCTLRDGGYYNHWCFKKELVQNYLNSCSKAGVDIVEIGLRSTIQSGFMGPYAYCTEDYLKGLELPGNLKLGVMINAKEYINEGRADTDLLNKYFIAAKDSPLTLVRIACHFREIPLIGPLVSELDSLGYQIGVNLMQAGSKSPEEIMTAIEQMNQYSAVEVLYFADSMGDMNPAKVGEVIDIFKTHWSKEIGIHTHDNMSKALLNSIHALDNGVTWLDGTILGMGRGAGNARTEYLISELRSRNINSYSPEALYPLALDGFKELHDKYEWGPNLMYYLSAEQNIHPTFIQEMMTYKNLAPSLMISAIHSLKNNSSYSDEKLSQALEQGIQDSKGTWSPKEVFEDREVLLIANGPSLKEHKYQIESYIENKKPLVIALNTKNHIDPKLIDFYTACHPMRVILESANYEKLSSPLIFPLESLEKQEVKNLGSTQVRNFGLKLSDDGFEIYETGASVPKLLVFAYALSVITSGKAREVKLCGFDGHIDDFAKHSEMERILREYRKLPQPLSMTALTPTTYSLKQASVYFPG